MKSHQDRIEIVTRPSYNKNDDMVERAEEAERMREHVIKERDKNKDRMISEDEFLKQVNKKTTGVQGVPSQVSELHNCVFNKRTFVVCVSLS